MEKRLIRRDLFARLRALSPGERLAHSASIRNWLAADPVFRGAATVFTFLSLPTEPDLAPLVAAFPGKRWVFPRVTPEDRMCFHAMESPDEAVQGDHGIREPDPVAHPLVEPGEADLFLIPGVGFDPAQRARIGRGKGHYDRYLAAAIAARGGAPAPRIGIAFSTQFIDLAPEAHDIAMHRIVSEHGWA